MLLLGVLQAQAAGGVAGSFDLLDEEILLSAQSSVTFSSLDTLAAGYQHLQIRAVAMTTANTRFYMRTNGVTSSSYSWHRLSGNGSGVSSEGNASQSAMRLMSNIWPASSSGAAIVIDILDPFETTKYTTVRALSGSTGSANEVGLFSGAYQNTAAISSVSFGLGNLGPGETNLLTGSRFSLYGIKAA